MEPERTIKNAEAAFRDPDVGMYGLSVWSAVDLSADEIVRLARSHDDREDAPQRGYMPHPQMRCSRVEQLQMRGFALMPDSPRGHYLLTIPTPPADDDWAALQEEFGAPQPTPSRQEV